MIFGLAFTFLYSSVVDPSHFDVDPDPGKEIDVDPKRRYKWIRIRPNVVDPDPQCWFTLCRATAMCVTTS